MKVFLSLFAFLILSVPASAEGYSMMLRFQDSLDTVMYLSEQFQIPKNDCSRDRKSVEAKGIVGRVRDKMKDIYFPIGKLGVIISNAPREGGFRANDPVDSYDSMVAFLKDENLLENAGATKPVNLRVTCEYDMCGKTYGTAVYYYWRDDPKCLIYIN